MSEQKVNWKKIEKLLGTMPDSELARKVGVTRARIHAKRKSLEIKKKKNHTCKLKCYQCGTIVKRKVRIENPICYECKKVMIIEQSRVRRENDREAYNQYWRDYRKKQKKKRVT